MHTWGQPGGDWGCLVAGEGTYVNNHWIGGWLGELRSWALGKESGPALLNSGILS